MSPMSLLSVLLSIEDMKADLYWAQGQVLHV